jgi:hypothetical protein
MNVRIHAIWLPLALAGGMSLATAAPVTITTPFMNLENRAVNSLGFATGEFLRIGANSVVPNGSAGTTGVGTTTNLMTGQPVSQSIVFNPGPAIPNFFARYLTDNPALYGPWTLTFTNGADHSQAVVSLPAGATQAPFVNTITLSGTSANPTFTWTPPSGARVNGYRVNIYDKALVGPGNNGQVTSRNLAPNVTSYTVSAGDFTVPGYAFQLDHDYSIEISLIQTKDNTSNNLGNDNLEAIARVYADFRATNNGGPAVNLPVVLANGSFQYNMAVAPGQLYYIDPAVAVGYDYVTGAGNPNFQSVVLPTGIGDGLYDIFGIGANHALTLLAHDWAGGATFDFGAGGIDAFRVAGIETSAGLDPASTTAFVTGLTFAGAGSFTGTQTPLTANVAAVPEPDVFALLLGGLGLVSVAARRRRSLH